jgi:hypothetical protein
LWSRWIRDTLTVLTGLGIEMHEALYRPAAPLMVGAGLVLVGKAPVEAVLARWLGAPAAPSPPTFEPPATRPPARSSS